MSRNLFLHPVPVLVWPEAVCEWHSPFSLSALMPFLFLEAALSGPLTCRSSLVSCSQRNAIEGNEPA